MVISDVLFCGSLPSEEEAEKFSFSDPWSVGVGMWTMSGVGSSGMTTKLCGSVSSRFCTDSDALTCLNNS